MGTFSKLSMCEQFWPSKSFCSPGLRPRWPEVSSQAGSTANPHSSWLMSSSWLLQRVPRCYLFMFPPKNFMWKTSFKVSAQFHAAHKNSLIATLRSTGCRNLVLWPGSLALTCEDQTFWTAVGKDVSPRSLQRRVKGKDPATRLMSSESFLCVFYAIHPPKPA